jgi:hypothetical protein
MAVRRSLLCLALTVLSILATTAVAVPARATGYPGGLMNAQTGLCLDSGGSSVYPHSCNGGDYQRWGYARNTTGLPIANKATSRCLDSDYSGRVYTLACNGGTYQRWYVYYAGGARYSKLVNYQTGLCLDSDAGRVYTHACNGGSYQTWYHMWV